MNNGIIICMVWAEELQIRPLIVVEKEAGIIYTLQVLLCSSLSGYHGMIHHHLTGFGVEHIPVHFKPAVSIWERNCIL